MWGASGAPLKSLRDDSALRALSSLRGLRGFTLRGLPQSLGQQMLERWAKMGQRTGRNPILLKISDTSKSAP